MTLQDFNPDTTSRRTYELEGGNKLYAERKNPYGFIRIHFDKGQIPENLASDYTSYPEADKAIQIYLNTKGRTLTNVINSHEEMK